MDQKIERIVQEHRQSFACKDKPSLSRSVQEVEEKCRASLEGEESKDFFLNLWFRLIKLSIELENAELSLILIGKLEITQLMTLNGPIREEEYDKSQILSYIADYFKIDYEPLSRPRHFNVTYPLISKFDENVESLIECGKWAKANDLIDTLFYHTSKNRSWKRRVLFEYAAYLELDESFDEALDNYAKSESSQLHSFRVIIKQHMGLAYGELKNYCLNDEIPERFWLDYSLLSGNHKDAVDACISVVSRAQISFFRGKSIDAEKKILKLLPDAMREFINNAHLDILFSKRKLEEMISTGTCLDSISRAGLALLANHYYQTNDYMRASSIYVCLDQIILATQSASYFLSEVNNVQFALHLKSTYDSLSTKLIENLNFRTKDKQGSYYPKKKDSQPVLLAYMMMGLVDEAIQVLCSDCQVDESIIFNTTRCLRNLFQDHKTDVRCLEKLDPSISETTFNSIQRLLSNNQLLSTHVITIVILSTTAYLLKLDTAINLAVETHISKLEIMFHNLSDFIGNFNFYISDLLLESTVAIVDAVKEKLDALSDSDIIREGFRTLVETVASKCLMESKYKSASMLYSQIEDSINAIKSLMRTGDIDLVVNYSLEVRDITVNRITINYLRHLNADPKIIEDFIKRSKP